MIIMIIFVLILVVFYTYFGYPLLLSSIKKARGVETINKQKIFPSVSFVVPAHNEEQAIGDKIRNILSLDYPKSNLEVVVVSDASTDKTNKIVESFSTQGVMLLKMDEQSGKIAAYRKALPHLSGEIVVFSDATSYIEKDSLGHLVSNFSDSTVGCVGALLKYHNPKDAAVGKGESKYWEYEKKIKELESGISSLTSVSGTLYGVRKELYPLNMRDDLADDLIVPLEVKKRGFRTVLEEKAICRESTALGIKEEILKRMRITIQNIRGLINQFNVLNPFRYGIYSLMLISHKLLRILVPAVLISFFVLTVLLFNKAWTFSFLLIMQAIFYFVGLAGYFLNKKIKIKLVNFVFYFCLSNLAILLGIFEFFRGKKMTTWKPVRFNS